MGANYDLIISSVESSKPIEGFLSDCGFNEVSVSALACADIDDASAVLLSPPYKEYVQIVADNGSLGVPIAEWFETNCLASALSRSGRVSIHLWSLDSGFVAGYSIFEDGSKVESDLVFSQHAAKSAQLMVGVPTPRKSPGDILGTRIARKEFDFATQMQAARSLEIGLGEIVSLFGFEIHLVDFFEALDEQEGIALENGKYRSVPLEQWTAIAYGNRIR